MNELLACTGWIALGVILVTVTQRTRPKLDRRYIWLCFWAHVASAFALLWITLNYFEGGDMEKYYLYGDLLAEWIQRDPVEVTPEVVKLIFQIPADLPIGLYGHEGTSTTTMMGITCFLMLVGGGAKYGTGIAFGLFAFSGQLKIYAAFRDQFPEKFRDRFMIAVLLVPSAIFWTSGVVKEAVALGAMGWMIWGIREWVVTERRLRAVAWLGIGAVIVSVVKGYVLFPMAAAASVWWFWHHSLSTKGSVAIAQKPHYLVGGFALAVVAMIGLGQVFPQYSVDQFAEQAAELQYQGRRITGGSSYSIGNPAATSLTGQLSFAPMAILTSLFRPFLFEAHNAAAFANGLEMAAITILWLLVLWTRGMRGIWDILRSSPALMFCLVFVLLFGLGVGLTTTNLGTLSRYRVPMMPMYLLILVMLLPDWSKRNR